MDAIIGWISSAFSYVGPFILLLGLLIFIHEWGHYAAARFFGVRVEVFSLGFGKKILKWVKGDTTYCVSMIPLGGYVKMYGDNPNEEIPEEEKQHSFVHKSVWPRIAIVAAGPVMNIIFAFLIFLVVPIVGDMQPAPTLGDIKQGTPAYEQGLRSGDRLIAINGEKIKSFIEIQEMIETAGPGSDLKVEVQREFSEELVQLNLKTTVVDANQLINWESKTTGISGLEASSRSALVGVNGKDTWAYKNGFRSLDIIKSINGTPVLFWREIAPLLSQAKGELKVGVLSFENQKTDPKVITVQDWSGSDVDLESLGLEPTELYMSAVVEDSPAEKGGIKAGDKIVAVNGQVLTGWDQLLKTVSGFGDSGRETIDFKISRYGEMVNLSITPKVTELMNRQTMREEKRYTVGILSATAQSFAPHVLVRELNPVKVLKRAWRDTVLTTSRVVLGFWKLISMDVSPKNISGVLRIGEVAGDFYKAGMSYFLKLMAMISVNLFILNLLPIPVLDGGHLLFYGIEAIKGSPVSLKKMEMAQQFGFIVLLFFMGFSLFNDMTYFMN